MKGTNRKIGGHILISCVIIILIIVSLLIFMKANNDRIVSQNESYIADATALSANHVNSRIQSKISNIRMIAALYAASMDSPEVDTSEIMAVCPEGYYDYIEFIRSDGQLVTASGKTADVSDTESYLNGMQGITGVCAVMETPLIDGKLLSFYTPMYYNGEIIGVLCGLYDTDGMQAIITNEFFGVTASIYLCTADGTVLTSAGVDAPSENILEDIRHTDKISPESAEKFIRAFENHESMSFNFGDDIGVESIYIAPLDYNGWIMIQSLPSQVTSQMRSRANKAGITLVSCIIAGFLVYIVFLIVVSRRDVRSLLNKNREINRIVESIPALFSRFAIVDLKNDSYYYVGQSDGIPPKGRYTDLMEYMNNYYIYEEDSVSIADAVTPEHICEHLTEDVPYLQYEYHINRESDRWENVSIICLKRENGKPVSILYAVQNITELKQKELESRIALKNAFDAAKAANQAKSEFLTRMSHDIRTPMNAVMGMTAVAAMHMDDKERLTDCLNKITSSSRHLLALINDILDMSKIESGKVTLSEEPFNLAEMTETILTIMHPQIKAKNQKISMSTSNVVHENLIGDTLRIRQVFVNIMGNAVKFTPEGGSISLDIREVESLISGKACYEFIFTDTGIGMEQSFIDRIFEPFSRSDNPNTKKIEGTGLGMAIAKNIVSMMNGDIKVESKIGEGSRFIVRLHLTIQNLDETDAHCLDGLSILVADDDKNAAENTREILTSIGMNAESVLSGEEAVAETVSRHERNEDFAAVILDWQMPDTNGVQAAAEIRRKVDRSVPIIILSAYDWADIEQEAREAGVNAFISKPLFRSRLIYVLKSLIAPSEQPENEVIDSFAENEYSGKRILLAEDNELNREIACELLEMIGLEVETAFDGKQAVELITQKPENYYDLVFMDIQMPYMNGYEATKAIRASDREDLKKIPIVAMSADAFSDDVFRAKEAGMNDHVSKPIEIPKLSEALEKWLKK